MRPKVFGIGFHKTGTTSLAAALGLLGYRVTGPNGVLHANIGGEVSRLASELIWQYDAFQDNPWPVLYGEIDRQVPGSKFILTVRPTGDWLASVVAHFGGTRTPMREWIYGAGDPLGHEQAYVERYERHNRDVLAYFSARPADLLVLPITAGAGWPELCNFLHADVPALPFPHRNAARERMRIAAMRSGGAAL